MEFSEERSFFPLLDRSAKTAYILRRFILIMRKLDVPRRCVKRLVEVATGWAERGDDARLRPPPPGARIAAHEGMMHMVVYGILMIAQPATAQGAPTELGERRPSEINFNGLIERSDANRTRLVKRMRVKTAAKPRKAK